MQVPAFSKDRDNRSCGFQQLTDIGILIHPVTGKPGGSEGSEPGVPEMEFASPGEELLVARIRPGPSAFNVVDTEFVKFLGNRQFVFDRERDGLALSTVPQRGIEREDFHGSYLRTLRARRASWPLRAHPPLSCV